MSILSELEKSKNYLRNSRNAILARGGEISLTAGLKDLPNAIYNIPADSSLAFPSDDTTAYRKVVPVGVEQMARVTKLGGMTYKCNNLCKPRESATITGGYDVTPNADGSVTVSGASTKEGDIVIHLSLTTIDLEAGVIYSSSAIYSDGATVKVGYRITYTDEDGGNYYTSDISYSDSTRPREVRQVYIQDAASTIGSTKLCGTYRIMINEGETALPYEPYYEGLRSAKVTSLKSEGAQLIPFPYKGGASGEMNGITYTVNSDGSIYVKGTATAASRFHLNSGVWADTSVWAMGKSVTKDDKTFTNCNYYQGALFIEYASGVTVDETIYPMLNYGSTPAPYTPYIGTLDTLAIPEAVQSLPDYGEGKSATEYNYIDFGRKVFKHDYAKIRLPSTVGGYSEASNWYYIAFSALGISPITRSVLCNLLPSVDIEGDSSLYGIYTNYSQTHIVMRIEGFTTASEYRQWLSDNEVYIVERLAEPIETDISAYLTSDGFFKVQGGGSVVAENEYEYAAPSNINYVQKVGT